MSGLVGVTGGDIVTEANASGTAAVAEQLLPLAVDTFGRRLERNSALLMDDEQRANISDVVAVATVAAAAAV